MKRITVAGGSEVLVDDEDYAVVSMFNWLIEWRGVHRKIARVYTQIGGRKRKKRVYLSRMLTREPAGQVDHKNSNGLDNRQANLRVCTPAQNSRNQRKTRKKCSSRFKGVSLRQNRHGGQYLSRPWDATIRVDGRKIRLGHFREELDAAWAYDMAARKYHGEFARTNFPTSRRPPDRPSTGGA